MICSSHVSSQDVKNPRDIISHPRNQGIQGNMVPWMGTLLRKTFTSLLLNQNHPLKKISIFWILIHGFSFLCLPDNQRKKSWKGLRKHTGPTILYYSMMDVWTVFENMQSFWTCMENVPSLCIDSTSTDILYALIREMAFWGCWFFGGFVFVHIFPSAKPKFPYFSSKPCFSPQSECRVMYSLSSFISPCLAKKVSSRFPPLHATFPKALITIGRGET